LILITSLIVGTGLEHTDIAIPVCTSAALTLAILGFFLGCSVAGYLLLYMQAVACFVANALCLPLLPGCHYGYRCKD
jgi:hypothetical protein